MTRKSHVKSRATQRGRLDPDLALVRFDQAARDRQAQASAG